MRGERGMTLVETLVAAVLLVTGVLGTFALVDIADRSNSDSSSREAATNISREVLEAAQSTPYAKIGSADWIRPRLAALPDGTGSVAAPNGTTNTTSVTRRKVTYSVTVTWCSVDDGRDGQGDHTLTPGWCSDSTAVGTADAQPEDFKRVGVRLTWSLRGRQQSLYQVATFSASGAAVGPTVGSLTITSPTVSNPSAPLIAANPSNGIVTFRGTSIGAGDMKFTVNGTEQGSGAIAGNGVWTYNWNISTLKDGVYTIGAIAVDALGTRGEPRTLQVTLNRGSPAPIANLVGGFNYATVNGTRKLILEGTWDANTEGNIIGYEVLRGSTVVCATSLATECADLNPPLSGTTAYAFRTWYRDGAGTARNISTTFSVPAPAMTPLPTQYHLTYDSSNPGGANTGTKCRSGSGGGTQFDMRSTAAAFTARTSGSGWVSGCLPPFPAGVSMTANNMTFASRWVNTSASDCSTMPVYLYLNGTTLIGGTGVNGGNTLGKIPKNTTSASPWTNSQNFNMSARSFAAGDQLSIHTPASTHSAQCAGSSLYFNSSSQPVSVTLPLTGGSTANLSYPQAPSNLVVSASGGGSTELTWNAAGGTSPSPDFYRIYRDGIEYANRYDTAGHTGDPTITWTDTQTGGTTHTYYVTTASPGLVESTAIGPVSG